MKLCKTRIKVFKELYGIAVRALIDGAGIEPATNCLQWWFAVSVYPYARFFQLLYQLSYPSLEPERDSNPRPLDYKSMKIAASAFAKTGFKRSNR